MIVRNIMINMTEAEHIMNQNSIRAEIERIEFDLKMQRRHVVKSLRDLAGQLEHNISNVNILLSLFDKESIDFGEIDTQSKFDYLIRDHEVFSNTMYHIGILTKYHIGILTKYQKTLQNLQKLSKELDY